MKVGENQPKSDFSRSQCRTIGFFRMTCETKKGYTLKHVTLNITTTSLLLRQPQL